MSSMHNPQWRSERNATRMHAASCHVRLRTVFDSCIEHPVDRGGDAAVGEVAGTVDMCGGVRDG